MTGAGESRKETCSPRRSLASPKSVIKIRTPAHFPPWGQVKIANVMLLQVSHHPPVSAVQVEGEGFVFHVTVQPKMKFWGKGVEVQPKGMVTLKFPK